VAGDTNGLEDIFVHDTITGETERVNLRSVGGQANVRGRYASISGDGRYVVWESEDGNLVAGDTNSRLDVFMHDRLLNQTQLISADSGGTIGNGTSSKVDISDNGRYVAFASSASNLVSGDANGFGDIIVHDIVTGEKKIVSLTSDGTQANFTNSAPKISGDGRYVVWESSATNFAPGDTNSQSDIFVHDSETGQTERVSSNAAGTVGNNASDTAAISGDGRYIIFESQASNLVSGDTNGANDIFFAGNPAIGLTEIGRNQWLKIDTQEEALLALSRLSSYLDELNQVAGDIGAVLSRFQVATGNLNSMKENYNAAESRITDADIASESSKLISTTILQQASSAVLSQANLQPEIALQLLRTTN
jgi:flagellin-like hook-associated protein FlgL